MGSPAPRPRRRAYGRRGPPPARPIPLPGSAPKNPRRAAVGNSRPDGWHRGHVGRCGRQNPPPARGNAVAAADALRRSRNPRVKPYRGFAAIIAFGAKIWVPAQAGPMLQPLDRWIDGPPAFARALLGRQAAWDWSSGRRQLRFGLRILPAGRTARDDLHDAGHKNAQDTDFPRAGGIF